MLLKQSKTAVVVPDVHGVFWDKESFGLMLQIAKSVKPDRMIQVGDIADFYEVSKYSKDPDRASGRSLQKECDFVYSNIISPMADLAPVTVLYGNHEERLNKYLTDKAPALCGLRGLDVDSLLGQGDARVSFTQTEWLGKLMVHHGDYVTRAVSNVSGANARRDVLKASVSQMMGHVHRLGAFYKRAYDSQLAGYEIGCLCSLNPCYANYVDWQQGFAVVHYEDSGARRFYVQLVQIFGAETGGKKRWAFYGGKLFTNQKGSK